MTTRALATTLDPVDPAVRTDAKDLAARLDGNTPVEAAVRTMLDDVAHGARVVVLRTEEEVTPAEAAKLLGVTRQLVDRLCEDGVLTFRRLPGSRHRRIRVQDVLDVAAEREQRRAAPELYRDKVTDDLSPDPDDRLHAAACIHGSVDVLLTRNLKHFRAAVIGQAGVKVMTSDAFLSGLLTRRRQAVVESFTRAANTRKNPPTTPTELADTIANDELAWKRQGLDSTFHATTDAQVIRDAVFAALADLDFRFDVALLEKRKAQPQTRTTSPHFSWVWDRYSVSSGQSIGLSPACPGVSCSVTGEQ